MVVDVSFLVKGPGNINTLELPLSGSTKFSIPINKPSIGSSAFSSTGNFNQPEGTSYYTDFTINAGHQMTVTGPTTIICTGTVTIGGNGIVGATTTNSLINNALEYFDGSFVKIPSYANSSGRSSGGKGNTSNSDGGARHVNGSSVGGSGNSGGGGGCNANGGTGYGGGSSKAGGVRGARQLGFLTIIANSIVVSSDINFDGTNGTNGTGGGSGYTGAGGGGGGNSGYLFAFSNTFTQTAGNITANAGDGGNGGNGDDGVGGGGGGADCGLIFLMSKIFSITGGSISAQVGSGGLKGSTGPSSNAQDGASGSFLMEFGTGVVCIEGDPFLA